jgi:hypothetical protein
MSFAEKKGMRPTPEQIEQFREELRRRISPEHQSSDLKALDLWELEPATFHRLWIAPLLDAGLSLEAAAVCIVQSYLPPN